MDNDDLRRGRPSTHRAFDEATAILAADAMQPLAFEILANHPALVDNPATQIKLVGLIAAACGANGMTGGSPWIWPPRASVWIRRNSSISTD